MKQLIYITGSGRSGSTLLDMLLSTHPEIAALGEVHRFSLNLKRDTNPHRCSCGELLRCCEFWKSVLTYLESQGVDLDSFATTWREFDHVEDDPTGVNIVEPYPELRFLGRVNPFNFASLGGARAVRLSAYLSRKVNEGKQLHENSWRLYAAVSEVTGRPIVVDGSKTPGRLLGLNALNKGSVPMKLVYLLRDGRGVTHARMKRQGVSMRVAAKAWLMEHRRIQFALKKCKLPVLKISYEGLCTDPDRELRRLLVYFGISGAADVGAFRDSTHSLGGNPMRFRKQERTIQLNETWRTELSKRDLRVFQEVAGKMNSQLGYFCENK